MVEVALAARLLCGRIATIPFKPPQGSPGERPPYPEFHHRSSPSRLRCRIQCQDSLSSSGTMLMRDLGVLTRIMAASVHAVPSLILRLLAVKADVELGLR